MTYFSESRSLFEESITSNIFIFWLTTLKKSSKIVEEFNRDSRTDKFVPRPWISGPPARKWPGHKVLVQISGPHTDYGPVNYLVWSARPFPLIRLDPRSIRTFYQSLDPWLTVNHYNQPTRSGLYGRQPPLNLADIKWNNFSVNLVYLS